MPFAEPPAISEPLARLCRVLRGDASAIGGEAQQQQTLALAQRHRVDPYLYSRFDPGMWHPSCGRVLAERYAQNTRLTLLAQAWTGKLITALAQSGIEARPLKGLPLAAQAYDRIADRHCGDIDLLVADPAVRARVDAPLHDLGLRRGQAFAPGPLEIYRFFNKSDDFFAPDGQRVEVHYLNHREDVFLPFLNFPSEAWEGTTIGSLRTYRLHGRWLLLYLLSHGMRQGWQRLKWLLDFDRLTAPFDDNDWAYLRHAAIEHDVLADFETGVRLLTLTLRVERVSPPATKSIRVAFVTRTCLRWLEAPEAPAVTTLKIKLLRRACTLTALSGMRARVCHLSSLYFRYPHIRDWRLPWPLIVILAPLAPLFSLLRKSMGMPARTNDAPSGR